MNLSNLIKHEEEEFEKAFPFAHDTYWFQEVKPFLTASLTRTVKAALDEVKLEEKIELKPDLIKELIHKRGYNQAVADQSEKFKNLLA